MCLQRWPFGQVHPGMCYQKCFAEQSFFRVLASLSSTKVEAKPDLQKYWRYGPNIIVEQLGGGNVAADFLGNVPGADERSEPLHEKNVDQNKLGSPFQ